MHYSNIRLSYTLFLFPRDAMCSALSAKLRQQVEQIVGADAPICIEVRALTRRLNSAYCIRHARLDRGHAPRASGECFFKPKTESSTGHQAREARRTELPKQLITLRVVTARSRCAVELILQA